MPIIISSDELRNNYSEISNKCHDLREPMIVTENGKKGLVIMSMETYDALIDANDARDKIMQGVHQAENGEVVSYEDVLASVKKIA